MGFKLRLLLFYLNHIVKPMDYSMIDAPTLRKINEKEYKKASRWIDFEPLPMFKLWEEQIKVRDGATIPVRIYQPVNKSPLPLIVFFHGGGFVTRSIDTHDKACRRIAQMNEAVVVSIGYRLAPEFKFPIPVYDCYDATCWAATQADRLGADPERLVVMGDSAGGNLATVVAIQARKLNGPHISSQVLIYPTTDGRMINSTIHTYGKGYLLTKALMEWFVDHYKAKEADKLDPRMSPLLEADLSNLPPTYLSTAEFDPLKGEGQAYAQRLSEAGNKVVFKEYKGMIHGFLNLPKITTKQTMQMHEDIKLFLMQSI